MTEGLIARIAHLASPLNPKVVLKPRIDERLRKSLDEQHTGYAALVARQIGAGNTPRFAFEVYENPRCVRVNIHCPQSAATFDIGYLPNDFGYQDAQEFYQAVRFILRDERGLPERRWKPAKTS